MRICGLQKTTLLDYPGKVACTLFLEGCNFRCPFCQNAELLDGKGGEDISEEELFSFLSRRQGILDGVCVTGGEPLLSDVRPLLSRIKELGFSVKLDTNGSFPARLKALVADGLVDCVAMDIKTAFPRYKKVAGADVDVAKIEESADFLLGGSLPYEFRTTVAQELHSAEDMLEIGRRLRGAKAYFLQNFRDGDTVLRRGLHPLTDEQLRTFKNLLLPYIPATRIRGEN